MKNASIILLTLLVLSSCSSKGLFPKKSQHEEYAEKLEKKGIDETPVGREWRAAAVAALSSAHEIKLPYAQKGAFYNDKPRALGLSFEAKKGERLNFHLSIIKAGDFVIYADLFRINGDKFEPVLSGDTNLAEMGFDVEETGHYVLRLQPEISRTGDYQLSFHKGPSLGFPVGNNKGKTGSFWGDSRDGGRRKHEGIDIFAPKKTPAIAAADGYITGVKDGGIGGKTVWLRVNGKNLTLYYAHLDQQLVREGQLVKKGEVIGLVGNTGNAKHTASHLHFGVYTSYGPVDPLPYVNQVLSKAAIPQRDLPNALKLSKTLKNKNGTLIKANTQLVPLAVHASGYIAELPDGEKIQVDFKSTKPDKKPTANAAIAFQSTSTL